MIVPERAEGVQWRAGKKSSERITDLKRLMGAVGGDFKGRDFRRNFESWTPRGDMAAKIRIGALKFFSVEPMQKSGRP